MPISEEEDGAQGHHFVLDLSPRLVLGRGRNVLGHQIEAWGEAVVQPEDQGFVAFHQRAVRRFVRREVKLALAVTDARLPLLNLIGTLRVPALRLPLLQPAAGEGRGVETDGRRADAVGAVGIQHALERAEIYLCPDVEPGPRHVCPRGQRRHVRGTSLDLLPDAAHPGLAADGSLPLVACLALEPGLLVSGQLSAVYSPPDDVHALEHTACEREAAVTGRGIGDLRNPVGVDIAHADATQCGIAAEERGARADAEQGHVGEDRIRAEQADVLPDLDRAPALVAEGEEVLAQVDGRGVEAGLAAREYAIQPGIEADGHADVEARLARLGAEHQRARQQSGLDPLLVDTSGTSGSGRRTFAAGEAAGDDSRRTVALVPGGKAVHVAGEREIPGAGLETDLR